MITARYDPTDNSSTPTLNATTFGVAHCVGTNGGRERGESEEMRPSNLYKKAREARRQHDQHERERNIYTCMRAVGWGLVAASFTLKERQHKAWHCGGVLLFSLMILFYGSGFQRDNYSLGFGFFLKAYSVGVVFINFSSYPLDAYRRISKMPRWNGKSLWAHPLQEDITAVSEGLYNTHLMIGLYEHSLSPMRWRATVTIRQILMLSNEYSRQKSLVPPIAYRRIISCKAEVGNTGAKTSDILNPTKGDSLILLAVDSCARLRRLSDGGRRPWLVLVIDDLSCCWSHNSLPLGATVVCCGERLADSTSRVLNIRSSRLPCSRLFVR